jgi:hypothetical protein
MDFIQYKNLYYFNSNSIELFSIQFKLHYANSCNIKSFKWNLISTKSTPFFHHFIIITGRAQQSRAYVSNLKTKNTAAGHFHSW